MAGQAVPDELPRPNDLPAPGRRARASFVAPVTGRGGAANEASASARASPRAPA